MALLDDIKERDPLYRPGFGNRVLQMTMMGRGKEARAYLDSLEPFLPGDSNLVSNRAWIDYLEGKAADGLQRMESALEQQPTDRVYRVGVNNGNYRTHQYEQVFDDHWSDFIVWLPRDG
jgi:predicted Zn-dependent protease